MALLIKMYSIFKDDKSENIVYIACLRLISRTDRTGNILNYYIY